MPAKQQSRVTGKLDDSTKAALALGPGPVSLTQRKNRILPPRSLVSPFSSTRKKELLIQELLFSAI